MDPSVPEVGVVVGALVAEWMIHLGFTNGRAGVVTTLFMLPTALKALSLWG
jgi:hypothetical protein